MLKLNRKVQGNSIFLASCQTVDDIMGAAVYQEILSKNIPVLNSNVLDYLLANPHYIPEEWKAPTFGMVFFWGTIYGLKSVSKPQKPYRLVRGLYRNTRQDSEWTSSPFNIDQCAWDTCMTAAVHAS